MPHNPKRRDRVESPYGGIDSPTLTEINQGIRDLCRHYDRWLDQERHREVARRDTFLARVRADGCVGWRLTCDRRDYCRACAFALAEELGDPPCWSVRRMGAGETYRCEGCGARVEAAQASDTTPSAETTNVGSSRTASSMS